MSPNSGPYSSGSDYSTGGKRPPTSYGRHVDGFPRNRRRTFSSRRGTSQNMDLNNQSSVAGQLHDLGKSTSTGHPHNGDRDPLVYNRNNCKQKKHLQNARERQNETRHPKHSRPTKLKDQWMAPEKGKRQEFLEVEQTSKHEKEPCQEMKSINEAIPRKRARLSDESKPRKDDPAIGTKDGKARTNNSEKTSAIRKETINLCDDDDDMPPKDSPTVPDKVLCKDRNTHNQEGPASPHSESRESTQRMDIDEDENDDNSLGTQPPASSQSTSSSSSGHTVPLKQDKRSTKDRRYSSKSPTPSVTNSSDRHCSNKSPTPSVKDSFMEILNEAEVETFDSATKTAFSSKDTSIFPSIARTIENTSKKINKWIGRGKESSSSGQSSVKSAESSVGSHQSKSNFSLTKVNSNKNQNRRKTRIAIGASLKMDGEAGKEELETNQSSRLQATTRLQKQEEGTTASNKSKRKRGIEPLSMKDEHQQKRRSQRVQDKENKKKGNQVIEIDDSDGEKDVDTSDSVDQLDDARGPGADNLSFAPCRIVEGSDVHFQECKVFWDSACPQMIGISFRPYIAGNNRRRRTRKSQATETADLKEYNLNLNDDVLKMSYVARDADKDNDDLNFLALRCKSLGVIALDFRDNGELMELVAIIQKLKSKQHHNHSLEKFKEEDGLAFVQNCALILFQNKKQQNEDDRNVHPPWQSPAYLQGKNEGDLILVYPFDGDRKEMENAAAGLKELAVTFEVPGENDKQSISDDRTSARSHYLTIRVGDCMRLQPCEYLNDTLIDFWMRWISRDGFPEAHFFSTHFYTTLEDNGVPGVQNWTAKKKINIFEKKFIFFPINKVLHWSLAVVVNPGDIKNDSGRLSCILFFDSLQAHSRGRVANNIRKWLNAEWKRIHKSEEEESIPKVFDKESMVVYAPHVPLQQNGYDCGVYVCRYAFAMCQLRCNEFLKSDCEIELAPRDRFQKLFGSHFNFDDADIGRIRNEMLKLLGNLHDLWNRKQEEKQKTAESAQGEKAESSQDEVTEEPTIIMTKESRQPSLDTQSSESTTAKYVEEAQDEPVADENPWLIEDDNTNMFLEKEHPVADRKVEEELVSETKSDSGNAVVEQHSSCDDQNEFVVAAQVVSCSMQAETGSSDNDEKTLCTSPKSKNVDSTENDLPLEAPGTASSSPMMRPVKKESVDDDFHERSERCEFVSADDQIANQEQQLKNQHAMDVSVKEPASKESCENSDLIETKDSSDDSDFVPAAQAVERYEKTERDTKISENRECTGATDEEESVVDKIAIAQQDAVTSGDTLVPKPHESKHARFDSNERIDITVIDDDDDEQNSSDHARGQKVECFAGTKQDNFFSDADYGNAGDVMENRQQFSHPGANFVDLASEQEVKRGESCTSTPDLDHVENDAGKHEDLGHIDDPNHDQPPTPSRINQYSC